MIHIAINGTEGQPYPADRKSSDKVSLFIRLEYKMSEKFRGKIHQIIIIWDANALILYKVYSVSRLSLHGSHFLNN